MRAIIQGCPKTSGRLCIVDSQSAPNSYSPKALNVYTFYYGLEPCPMKKSDSYFLKQHHYC